MQLEKIYKVQKGFGPIETYSNVTVSSKMVLLPDGRRERLETAWFKYFDVRENAILYSLNYLTMKIKEDRERHESRIKHLESELLKLDPEKKPEKKDSEELVYFRGNAQNSGNP